MTGDELRYLAAIETAFTRRPVEFEGVSPARLDACVAGCSTAGSEQSERCRLYDYGKRVETGELDDRAFLFDWAEADAGLDPHDGPGVRAEMARQANPHVDQFGLLPFIERRWHEIPEHEWRRYFANQFTPCPP